MNKAVHIAVLVMALAGSGLSAAAASDAALRAAGAKKLLASTPMIADSELAGMRAGFFTAAGAQFDFGATVSTTINGQLALQTNLTWTPAGAAIQQLSGLGAAIQSQVASNLAKVGIADPATSNIGTTGATVPSTTVATTSAAPAATPANVSAPAASMSIPANVASIAAAPAALTATTAPAATAPAATAAPASAMAATNLSSPVTAVAAASPMPTTVATITNIVPTASSPSASSAAPTILTGVQLQSATGTTQILSNIGANQLQNILINSASNQDIVQNTNLVFTIYNFADWQKQLAQNSVSAQLANQIMNAAGLGGSR